MYPVVYMFTVTFLFTVILVGFARFTQPRVAANEQIFFERAVLMAGGAEVDSTTPPAEVHARFVEQVQEPDATSRGAWRVFRGGKLVAYALPFEGRGFWNVIKGIAGIREDGRGLVGVAFQQQSETPGLGAEIAKAYFCDRFVGLVLSEAGAAFRIKRPGEPLGRGEIHGISGATQTTTRVEAMMNRALATWYQAR